MMVAQTARNSWSGLLTLLRSPRLPARQTSVLVRPHDEPLGCKADEIEWVASHERDYRFVCGGEGTDVIGINDSCPIYLVVEYPGYRLQLNFVIRANVF